MSDQEWWKELTGRPRRMLPFAPGRAVRWPDAIRLVNLRSLEDTEELRLAPLMVLVGANGSGKSTFARFFPLLKQSVETATRGPVLWYQQDLVDFGSFEEAVHRDQDGNRSNQIELHFVLDPFKIALILEGDRRETRLVQVVLHGLDGDQVTLAFDAQGRVSSFIAGSGLDVLALEPDVHWRTDLSGVIPSLWNAEDDAEDLLIGAIEALLHDVFHGNTAAGRRRDFARGLRYSSDLRPQFQQAGFGKKWAKNTTEFLETPWKVLHLRWLLFARSAPALLNMAAAWLEGYARGVAYIGPFRATPQRFYRQQDLAIDVIDPKGSNLAMFLRSLTDDEMSRLNQWLDGLFDFGVSVEADGSQDTINLRFKDANTYNLVDTGFGFSQLLPVLVQLWAMAFRDLEDGRRGPVSVVVIEQPELHLHPHQQALFARALADVVKAGRARLVVETHSEAIVNELGASVQSGGLGSDDVRVLCFEPDQKNAASRVRVAEYDAEGGLLNWPVGFFLP